MRQGDVIADRFEIERLAGSGGMGQVYEARDRSSGFVVALKVLHDYVAHEYERFTREAQALAAIGRDPIPGVVRYIDHGVTALGDRYLAMEWLSGETLAERLARKSLTVAESITVAHRTALVLGEIHRRRYVHRDLNPNNIFLVDGSLERVTLIDFGIARLPDPEHLLTVPGTMLGTPSYIAPEQARSALDVDARADVFSLGCVLFKCLTGRAPFIAKDGLSVMLRILLDDAPKLSELRDDIPAALDTLVAQLLAKDPTLRPIDGDLAAAKLEALSGLTGPSPCTIPPPSGGFQLTITTSERRMMCLVLASNMRSACEAALTAEEQQGREQALRLSVKQNQGELELLADRSLFVVYRNTGAATDLAAQAARSALAIQAILVGVPIAVVTGRGVISSRLPVGELIDRAVGLLAGMSFPSAHIRVDEVTAGLLGAAFDIGADDIGPCLRGPRDTFAGARTLLGKATPFVGRKRELGRLAAIFAQTAADLEASVVLVTGPAGMGKSRLGYELVRELRSRGSSVAIWIGRGDPMRAGSAFSVLGEALRRTIGLFDGEPIEVRRQKIQARVAQHSFPPAEQARIAAFLGELIGTPFPTDDSIARGAARRDPVLRGDQMRRAFEDFLAAECAVEPVLLVLEDLHWGDLPTVSLVDAALRHLKDRPLMVLGFARPEVHALFPGLFQERGLLEIELGGLPRPAAEQLVKQVLGDGMAGETVATLIERADGNAFYLEELIRAVAEGGAASSPQTVVSMIEARLEALDAETRRLLRAASVFGQTFWEGGVKALVGALTAPPLLDALVEKEIFARQTEARFPGETEYTFRHALVREAAYAMLTDADRALGHLLAGEWLERAGLGEPVALAEHFERGREPARAAACYHRAAEQAFEGNDLEAALARADRALACLSGEPNHPGSLVGELLLLKARAHRWRGENAEAERAALEAMVRLPRASAPFCDAAGELSLASSKLGHVDHLLEAAEALLALGTSGEVSSTRVIALSRASIDLHMAHQIEQAEALLVQAEALSLMVQGDPTVVAQLAWARALRAYAEGDVGEYLRLVEVSLANSEQAGDLRRTCSQNLSLGYAHLQLGADDAAERALRAALVEAERLGLRNVGAYAKHNLGLALARQGKLGEARAIEEQSVAACGAQQDRWMEAASRIYLAMILRLSGELYAAEREGRAVLEHPATAPELKANALAVVAEVLLGGGREAEALRAAREAMEILRELGKIEEGEARIRLVYAEALLANGDRQGAWDAVRSARERLLVRAGNVRDEGLRESFLRRVPENARTLALGRELFGE
jgi:predicted ATPase